jgi:hypothetical protein
LEYTFIDILLKPKKQYYLPSIPLSSGILCYALCSVLYKSIFSEPEMNHTLWGDPHCLNVLTLVMTDEEKHLSREAMILTGVPMKTNVSSSWLTFIALQNYSFLNKSIISKCHFIFQFISTFESLYYPGLGPSWNYFILYIIYF